MFLIFNFATLRAPFFRVDVSQAQRIYIDGALFREMVKEAMACTPVEIDWISKFRFGGLIMRSIILYSSRAENDAP